MFFCEKKFTLTSFELFRIKFYLISSNETRWKKEIYSRLIPSLSLHTHIQKYKFTVITSVTRLGDFWVFGRLFKACGNNIYAQIAHILGLFRHSVIFIVKFVFGLHFIDIGRFLIALSSHPANYLHSS